MPLPQDDAVKFRNATIVLLTVVVSAVFIGMIQSFLMALLLAAIGAGLAQPLHRLSLKICRGRPNLSAIATLIVLVLLVLLPLLGLAGVVAVQAVAISNEVVESVKEDMHDPAREDFQLPPWIPYREKLMESSGLIVTKLGELAGKVGSFFVTSLSAATAGTAQFFLNLFIMLYAMFFFLKDGTAIRDRILKFLPLTPDIKKRLIEKGMSVTRATVKGTLIIGLFQGFLGGLAFAVAGIDGFVLWGVVMAVCSVIPGIGTALIWLPAVVFLLATGQIWTGVLLAIWCAGVVGSVDNILRPRLVGGDTEMPDLLILVSTLGGLTAFGMVGLLIGPVIAALFVTMWDILGITFGDLLSRAEKPDAEGAS